MLSQHGGIHCSAHSSARLPAGQVSVLGKDIDVYSFLEPFLINITVSSRIEELCPRFSISPKNQR